MNTATFLKKKHASTLARFCIVCSKKKKTRKNDAVKLNIHDTGTIYWI